jgi:hypothetical protein
MGSLGLGIIISILTLILGFTLWSKDAPSVRGARVITIFNLLVWATVGLLVVIK